MTNRRALLFFSPAVFSAVVAALNAIEGYHQAAREWIIITMLWLIADDVNQIRRRGKP